MRLLPFDLYALSDSIEAGLVLDDAGLIHILLVDWFVSSALCLFVMEPI